MKKSLLLLLVVMFSISTFSCFRGLTRPTYYEQAGFTWDEYEPLDIDYIVSLYPALKGRIFTAPEYMERKEKEEMIRKAKGEPPKTETKIDSGANLRIELVGEPDLTRDVIVNIDGYFDYPYIGEVVARGKTLRELKQEMTERLKEFYVEPMLTINLTQWGLPGQLPGVYTPGAISIFSPLGGRTQHFSGKETISQVIANAGALTPDANWRAIRVIREDPETKQNIVIVCDFYNLLVLGDRKQDIQVAMNDIIIIPKHHSIGDQFKRDWDILLDYLTGARDYNELRIYYRDNFWR